LIEGVILKLAPGSIHRCDVIKTGYLMEEQMSEMSEMIRKMGLFSVGIISLTQEKAEEFTQEMIKKGEMSREEGKKFVKEVLSEKEKQLNDLEDKINEKVEKVMKKSGVVMKSDISALEKKIEKLEKTIQTLSKK
jgi:polyhydroxyalkanoate synthesis regulator phasin